MFFLTKQKKHLPPTKIFSFCPDLTNVSNIMERRRGPMSWSNKDVLIHRGDWMILKRKDFPKFDIWIQCSSNPATNHNGRRKDVEVLFIFFFIYLILRAIFFVIADGIYSVFGDDTGDAILLAPLVIVLLLVVRACVV